MAAVMRKIREVFKGDSDKSEAANKPGAGEDDVKECEDKLGEMAVAQDNANDMAASGIVKVDCELPKSFKGRLAFVLYNVFTQKECKTFIKETEKKGYEEALVNIGYGRQLLMTDVRNNERCIWDSVEESGRMWDRIKPFVPEVWAGRKVMGLNERLRFLKYVPGQYFKPHMDGNYKRDNGERSYITIQLYLNEGFKGGSTTFLGYDEKERVEIVPKTGSVLVFQHDILHEGSELIEGTKYTCRTDVMYAAAVTEGK